jgi:CheY-like chemotaxis protein
MSKGHILVVEDNLDNYELVHAILEFAGYDTFLAVNGQDGVYAARKQKPDLILMDMSVVHPKTWTDGLNKINCSRGVPNVEETKFQS